MHPQDRGYKNMSGVCGLGEHECQLLTVAKWSFGNVLEGNFRQSAAISTRVTGYSGTVAVARADPRSPNEEPEFEMELFVKKGRGT